MGVFFKAKIHCKECNHEFYTRMTDNPKNKINCICGNEYFSKKPKTKNTVMCSECKIENLYPENARGQLLVKCPKCKEQIPQPKKPKGTFYIDFMVNGQRMFEEAGRTKKLALSALNKRKTEVAENRFFPEKRKENRISFQELATWYLNLSEVKAKKSYYRDKVSIKILTKFFKDKRVTSIKKSDIENYRAKRKTENSYRKNPVAIASINKELACLKRMFSLAVQDEKVEKNPVKLVKLEKENNERDRVLTKEEHERLLSVAAPHLKNILVAGYHTAMRKSELLNLTWDKVDFKNSFIRLSHEDTKSNEKRIIPLNKELTEMFNDVKRIRNLHNANVFLLNGKPIKSIRECFKKAVEKSGIEDFVFHDYRHTCITNWRRAGVDYLTIMKMSGHKTVSCFKRYNTIDEQDLKTALGKVDNYLANEKQIDSRIDTKEGVSLPLSAQAIEK